MKHSLLPFIDPSQASRSRSRWLNVVWYLSAKLHRILHLEYSITVGCRGQPDQRSAPEVGSHRAQKITFSSWSPFCLCLRHIFYFVRASWTLIEIDLQISWKISSSSLIIRFWLSHLDFLPYLQLVQNPFHWHWHLVLQFHASWSVET